MYIEICKTCKRFREVERHCSCDKATVELYDFWRSKTNFMKEGILLYSTFFTKEMPRGCKYAVGKKKYERGQREFDKCVKCKNFHLSPKRYKCTFDKGNIFYDWQYNKKEPNEKCENKIEHIICMEAIK